MNKKEITRIIENLLKDRKEELSNILEEKTNVHIDVIKLNNASDSVIYKATKGLLLKDNDSNKRINFINHHWKRYWDFNPKIQEHIIELKHGSR